MWCGIPAVLVAHLQACDCEQHSEEPYCATIAGKERTAVP
jgi:hypothetical protein